MPMKKGRIKDLLRLIEEFRNYLMWGVIVFFALSIALYFKSTNTILVVTGLIIFFYTYETYKMRKAITENTELNTRPILSLEIDFSNQKAYVRDFSNFPAYNFSIEDYDFEAKEKHAGKVKEIFAEEETTIDMWEGFRNIDVIPPKDKVTILEGRLGIVNAGFFRYLDPSVFRS
jgi:hypothetical protein